MNNAVWLGYYGQVCCTTVINHQQDITDTVIWNAFNAVKACRQATQNVFRIRHGRVCGMIYYGIRNLLCGAHDQASAIQRDSWKSTLVAKLGANHADSGCGEFLFFTHHSLCAVGYHISID